VTFIHECLHWLEPNWTENQILTTEEQVAMKMSKAQWKNLLARIAEKLCKQG
jgi:hypothetical protein